MEKYAFPAEFPEGEFQEDAHGGKISHASIREELDRVLHSEEFRASKRSQEFLAYVVEQTLKGSADVLKERTIGIDVFHRSPAYDPGEDATVRVKAGEVRKRLGLYYSTAGAHNPIRIELASGTYVPAFRRTSVETELPASAMAPMLEAEPRHAEPARKTGNKRLLMLLPVFALLILGTSFLWIRGGRPQTILEQFWAPVFKEDGPISLCVAYVPVYGLDREATPSQPIRADEFVQMKDQFVGGGDLMASMRLSAMLTRERHPYLLKVGSDVSFHDLRTGPAILIGYSYTRWKEISSQMRFFIDGSRVPIGITDNGVPTNWTLPDLPPDRKTDRDFAIVSRVFHPDTHAMLVELAGITSYGTDAAGDLVTSPELMAEALRGSPVGWQTKNLQLVLSVKVIGGSAASPKVVASHFW
jgi:hypothetical protein